MENFLKVPRYFLNSNLFTVTESVFLSEVISLSENLGYCYADLSYFATLLHMREESVKNMVIKLRKLGYLKTEYIKLGGRCGTKHKVIKPTEPLITLSKIVDNTVIEDNEDQEIILEIWSMYPRKKGRSQGLKYIAKRLKDVGESQLITCIERYKEDIDRHKNQKEYMMNGDKFFKEGYVDYLNENYSSFNAEEPQQEVAPTKEEPQQTKPVSYDMEALVEKMKNEVDEKEPSSLNANKEYGFSDDVGECQRKMIEKLNF